MIRLFRLLTRPLEFTGRGGYFELLKLAYPLILMSASNTIMQFIDRKFLALSSTVDVAAAMPAGILYFTLFCLFLSAATFTSTIVAQYHGSNDRQSMLSAVWSGVYFAIGAGLIITFIVPFAGRYLIGLGGHSPDLYWREIAYFDGLIPSGVFACLAAPFFSFFSGQGRTLPVAVINILACVLNIFMDYVFIFGWGPIPAMGIFGAGITTSFCAMLAFLSIFIYFLLQNQDVSPTRRNIRPKWEGVTRLIRYGIPTGVQVAFDCGAFALVSFTVGTLGSSQLAAHTIALSINNMFFIPLLGLSDATSILIGQYIGRSKHSIARRIAYRAWRVSILYMMLGGIVYLFFPEALAEMFRPKVDDGSFPMIVELAGWLLVTAFVFNMSDTLKFIFAASLRGAGDTRPIMLICMSCAYLLMVPGVLVIVYVFKGNVIWVWVYLVFTATLEGVLIMLRFRSGKWRHIRMIRPAGKIARLDEKRQQAGTE
jgi:MATE family multidrug resistance protein